MASLTDQAKAKYLQYLSSGYPAALQQSLLNTLFPNNFELYFVALELVNSLRVTTDRFVFPINPTSISAPEQNIANVQKTAGGIVSNYVTSTSPNQIVISGHFGRDFKVSVMNRANYNEFKKIENIVDAWQNTKIFVSETILTGFGCYNALKRIFEKSRQLDESGKPYRTIFYNLVYSSANYVQLKTLDSSMTFDKNRIHTYQLTMQKLGAIGTQNTIKGAIIRGQTAIAAITEVAQSVSNSLNNITNQIKL